MTTDPERPAVPGLERTERVEPPGDTGDVARFSPADHPRVVEPVAPPSSRRLGAADDPDRFDAARDGAAPGTEPTRALDPRQDPDRFLPPGQGQTLKDLLGEAGTHEGSRDGYQWVAGLIGVFLFLALVAFLFSTVLTP